jgi:hypothetical protein
MQLQTLPITRAPARTYSLHDPAYQAFMLLRTAFTVAPIAFGVDKASNLLTDWQQYLSPTIDQLVPGTAHQLMPESWSACGRNLVLISSLAGSPGSS